MNQDTLEWLSRQPKAKKGTNPDGNPDPMDEAVRKQQQAFAESIDQDTNAALKARSETLKVQQEAQLAKALADLAEQQARRRTMEGETTGGKKDRLYSVVNGELIPDPDEGYPIGDALKIAAMQKERSGPVYYVQNPETGQYSEVRGPVIIPQQTPPVVYSVDAITGDVQQLQPGQPIVVKPPPAPAQSQGGWIMTPDGNLQEVKPGFPIVIQQPAPQQARWMVIKPDGSLEESEPGRPIVIQREAPAQQSQPAPYQIIGPDGNPVTMTKEQLDMQMNWWEFQDKLQGQQQTRKAIIGVLDEAKKHFGTMVKAGDRALKMGEKRQRAQPPASQPPAQLQAAPQDKMITLTCPECEGQTTVMLRAVKNANDTFQCSHCGATSPVQFE